ncbi:MAG: HAD-IIB family hydrolase [Gemmatimonadaceae bacterium]
MPRTLLFSDVDGTLLDADDRLGFTPDDLASLAPSVELILNSSRTIPELCALQDRLAFRAPMVAENGALVAMDAADRAPEGGYFHRVMGRRLRVFALAKPALVVRAQVGRIAAAMGAAYDDQRDVLTRSATAHTPAARQALQRTHSVLFRARVGEDAATHAAFIRRLRDEELFVTSGGQWTAVVDGSNKGMAARWLVDALRTSRKETHRIAAIGDGENDEALLAYAECAFVVRNDDGSWHRALTGIPGAVPLKVHGIAGWLPTARQLSDSGSAPC